MTMFDTVITLKSAPVITYDNYGNEEVTTTDREVYAIPRSVYKSEFYAAAQIGLHPSITFRITNTEDYQGEKVLEHDGKAYSVIRADWTAQRDAIDLVCAEKVGITPEPDPPAPNPPAPDSPGEGQNGGQG